MTNTELLRDLIKASGLKVGYVAEKLGISRASFSNKLDNKNEFKASEIVLLCDLLGITSLKAKEEVFFARKVDK